MEGGREGGRKGGRERRKEGSILKMTLLGPRLHREGKSHNDTQ
jgi:hypothetical protein